MQRDVKLKHKYAQKWEFMLMFQIFVLATLLNPLILRMYSDYHWLVIVIIIIIIIPFSFHHILFFFSFISHLGWSWRWRRCFFFFVSNNFNVMYADFSGLKESLTCLANQMLARVVNVYDQGSILSIVTDSSPHYHSKIICCLPAFPLQ